MKKTKLTKRVKSIIAGSLFAVISIVFLLSRKKKNSSGKSTVASNTLKGIGNSLASTTVGTSSSSIGFIITGVGQVVTGASPKESWHVVYAPARVFNIQTNPTGKYSGFVTINSQIAYFEDLDTSPNGYPAIFFNPTDSRWGISTPGTYQVSITLSIGGQSYTQTTNTIVTSQDLGQDNGGGDNGGGGNGGGDNGGGGNGGGGITGNTSILEMHELQFAVNGTSFSDIRPALAQAFGREYHSFYIINDDETTLRSTFNNVDLSEYGNANGAVMIRKIMVDKNFFPDYPTFLSQNWRIGRNNSENLLLRHEQAFIKI